MCSRERETSVVIRRDVFALFPVLDEANRTALLAVDQAQLNPGATATADYTFPDSAAGAQLEFSCLIRRHYDDGMLLPITVTK